MSSAHDSAYPLEPITDLGDHLATLPLAQVPYPPSFVRWRTSFLRSLRAQNASPRTLETYTESLNLFGRFLLSRGQGADLLAVTRVEVEEFVADLLSTGRKPSTANNRWRGLRAFYRWLVNEEEIARSPFAKMHPPQIPEATIPVFSDDDLARLLKACGGAHFEGRRDTAIIRLLLDTGMRLSELAGLTVERVSLDDNVCAVLGKYRRERVCPFGPKTAQALDRYLRARARHAFAAAEVLWLGSQGPITAKGIYLMLRRRGAEAGVERIFTHMFRHTAAHKWLAAGGQETSGMRIFGWKSHTMVSRYGAALADERAREEYRKLHLNETL